MDISKLSGRGYIDNDDIYIEKMYREGVISTPLMSKLSEGGISTASLMIVRRLSSVKGFNKTMSSSLGESNRRMMVRSSPKLFWNGVLDRIIRLLVRISAKAFQIAIYGRLLLNFVPKSELSY